MGVPNISAQVSNNEANYLNAAASFESGSGSNRIQPQVLTDWGYLEASIGMSNLALDLNKAGAGTAVRSLRFAAKAAPVANVLFGAADAVHAHNFDIARGDRFRTETTKSMLGTSFNVLLGGAAVVAVTGAGVAVLPAVGLGILAGMAGQAIGQEIGGAVVSLRKHFDW